jgi:hypothetical protein
VKLNEEKMEMLTNLSMTLTTASRAAVVSRPTSSRATQKGFPSATAASAMSVAVLIAFWMFFSPCFFFAFLSCS